MAHYTVAVISKDLKDVENLLLPYAIYNLGDAKEITYTRNEVVSRSRDKLEEFNKFIYSRYLIDAANTEIYDIQSKLIELRSELVR
ncbi:hypothetical protein [Clostridium sp. SM-530-WT-3G]|uniref:hypothetical protein n=1 Tax=Clostridium sp. SM-530-WT-3G TaxID=2725303 RepID=UPI00145EA3B1|nr:hypothetical protein [Clostridium sp. SM-530-WT-3G]NME82069.1 hypothetical protein [Clostridium sp. SM-530-WT-3G]